MKKAFVALVLTIGIILGLLSAPINNPSAIGLVIPGTLAIGFLVIQLKNETKNPFLYGFLFSLSFSIALTLKSLVILFL